MGKRNEMDESEMDKQGLENWRQQLDHEIAEVLRALAIEQPERLFEHDTGATIAAFLLEQLNTVSRLEKEMRTK